MRFGLGSLLHLVAFLVLEVTGLAHPIPTLVVDAVFEQNGECELKVNLDPRLFLHAVPSTLPPIPGSWWTEQDAASQEKQRSDARAYLARTLQFLQSTSTAPLNPTWEVIAIDSVLVTPLTPTSAESHLLARYRGKLSAQGGEFRVSLDKSAAVPMILVNKIGEKGKPEPQSVYPGESSRGFVLPHASVTAVTAAPQDSGSVRWRIIGLVGIFIALNALVLWQRFQKKVRIKES